MSPSESQNTWRSVLDISNMYHNNKIYYKTVLIMGYCGYGNVVSRFQSYQLCRGLLYSIPPAIHITKFPQTVCMQHIVWYQAVRQLHSQFHCPMCTTLKSPNKGHFQPASFIPCRELALSRRFKMYWNYRGEDIFRISRYVPCREVVPVLECQLSEISLYYPA